MIFRIFPHVFKRLWLKSLDPEDRPKRGMTRHKLIEVAVRAVLSTPLSALPQVTDTFE